MNLLEIFSTIAKYKKVIVVNFIIVATLSATISLLLPKWYRSTVLIMPPASQSPLGSIGVLGNIALGGILSGGDENQNRFIAILKSRRLLTDVVDKFDLWKIYDTDTYENALAALQGNMKIEIGDEMQIKVSLFDQDQEGVANILNYAINRLDSINIDLATQKAHNNRIFIESRLFDVIDSLAYLENDFISFLEINGVLSLPDQITAGITQAGELKSIITQKEIELAVSKQVLDSENPTITRLNIEIQVLQKKYDEYFSERNLKDLFPNFNDIPSLQLSIERISRKIKYHTTVLEFLGPQYEQAKIEEIKNVSTVQVLDWGARPEKRSRPHRTLIVLVSTMLSTLLLAYGLIVYEKYTTSKK
ncbi:MAG: Wzz/FepE/Etk N-terminal domain-containing protein [Candidatus Marinimicrobia bacterium]|nr:Wzz/FepE/Etk N-terminal domain-containing protein [Candidatus Neomarinimicrobiota bacterium]